VILSFDVVILLYVVILVYLAQQKDQKLESKCPTALLISDRRASVP
jgi:hypothetical protein